MQVMYFISAELTAFISAFSCTVFLLYAVSSVVGNSDLFGLYKKFKQVFL